MYDIYFILSLKAVHSFILRGTNRKLHKVVRWLVARDEGDGSFQHFRENLVKCLTSSRERAQFVMHMHQQLDVIVIAS